MYDPEFEKFVKKIAPRWFESNRKKSALLAMAAYGSPRPKTYDPEFTKYIRNQWFKK